MPCRIPRIARRAVLVGVVGASLGAGSGPLADPAPCAFRRDEDFAEAMREAVLRGELSDPALRARPTPRAASAMLRTVPGPLTPADIFPYEDTGGLFVGVFTDAQMFDFMVQAANALLAVHGDGYDFIGFWMNFDPSHMLGGAFYLGIQNEVTGIGKPLFDAHVERGLSGQNVQGLAQFYNINAYYWQPPPDPWSDFTQLLISHELEHRFAMALPELLDGRKLQGTASATVGGPCGKEGHWSYKADAQGSGMEVAEWTGSEPAIRQGGLPYLRNTDTGGVFSIPDLYLMGYLSATEMDQLASQLRYMDQSVDCATPYDPLPTAWGSADVLAAAGPRVPDSESSQKHFRAAWIMIHQPGDPPSAAEVDKAIAILERHQLEWEQGTLGRGTIDHALTQGSAVAVPGPVASRAESIKLHTPIPTPTSGRTSIRYTLSQSGTVTVTVHDLLGRLVATLDHGPRSAGDNVVDWTGVDRYGKPAVSGTYLVRLDAGPLARTVRVVVIR